MLRKVFEYTDFDGNQRKETHYFNLNKAETIKWLATSGDYTLDKVLQRLYTERNGREIISIFEDLIHRSYGVKSLDGRKFEKSEEIWNNFYQTEAYSMLFTELVTDAKKAADFVNQIIPKDLADDAEKMLKDNPDGIPNELKGIIDIN